MTTNVGHGRTSRQAHPTRESQWPRHIGRKHLIMEVRAVEHVMPSPKRSPLSHFMIPEDFLPQGGENSPGS